MMTALNSPHSSGEFATLFKYGDHDETSIGSLCSKLPVSAKLMHAQRI